MALANHTQRVTEALLSGGSTLGQNLESVGRPSTVVTILGTIATVLVVGVV